jgi:hypothetical protein
MTAKWSDYDDAHIADILSGHGDWFSAQLMRLIMKADRSNRDLIAQVFPDHVEAYERYQRGDYED